MGLIRKALFVSSGGVVSPNSKKQRVAKQSLAAAQGKSAADVRLAGGRLSWAAGAPSSKERSDTRAIKRVTKNLLSFKEKFHDRQGSVMTPVDVQCSRLAAEGSYRCRIIFNTGHTDTYVVNESKQGDGKYNYSWAPLR